MEGSFVTILFTDLVGSTSLFQHRGDDAADALRRRHFDVLRLVAARHGGRVVKSTGDGLMVAFASAATAVRCAADMQREATSPEDGVDLRVGIGAGEPIADEDDLYGTPVIVASRLCDAAGPGEVLVSDVVRQVAGARVADHLRPAGAIRLAGFTEPLTVARLDWAGPRETPAPLERSTRPIGVVVADDERLLRTGFRVILDSEPDISVIGEAADGLAAVHVVRRCRPDVVLMDIRMPELDGLAAAEQIIADPDLSAAVVMLTTFDANDYVYEALRIGASGFLLKDAPSERLLDAVRVAAAGEALIAPAITRRLIEQFTLGARPAPGTIPSALAELTARELDVLRLIARGMSNAEIAGELILGENTVKTHVARLLSKLGLRDRVQAVVKAYETGLVTRELSPLE